MANLPHGILGAFTGSVGPVTGYLRNGKNILRSSRSVVADKTTPLRQAQREKICLCTAFAKAFSGSGFLNKSFPAYGHGGNGYNRAVSALMSLAVTGLYPGIALNYALVLVSRGRLPGAQDAVAVPDAAGIIHFTFTNNSADGIASNEDSMILVAYSPALQQAIYTLHGGARKDGQAILDAGVFKGHTVETWIGCLNPAQTDAADSVYTGRMLIA